MELEGTATVEQLIARYAHAIDDRRFDDAGRLFATDARLVVGRHTFDGRDAIVATMLAAAASSEPGKHICTNIDAEVEGMHATVASDFVMIASNRTVASAGRYLDQLICTNGRWQFQQRQIVVTIK
jgi:hypothetical protein